MLGIVLMILDFLVIPGGIVAIVGIICMIGGVVGAFVEFGTTIGFLTLLCTTFLTIGSVVLMMRSKTWRKIQLKTKIDSKMNEIDISHITSGSQGISISRLAPMGTGIFGETEIEVISLQGFINENTPIIIKKIEGSKVYVTEFCQ